MWVGLKWHQALLNWSGSVLEVTVKQSEQDEDARSSTILHTSDANQFSRNLFSFIPTASGHSDQYELRINNFSQGGKPITKFLKRFRLHRRSSPEDESVNFGSENHIWNSPSHLCDHFKFIVHKYWSGRSAAEE